MMSVKTARLYEEYFFEDAYWTVSEGHQEQRTGDGPQQYLHEYDFMHQNETMDTFFVILIFSIKCRNCWQPLLDDRYLLFESAAHANGIVVYAHIIDGHIVAIQARNDSEQRLTLRKDTLPGIFVDYEVEGYLLAHLNVAFMAASSDILLKG